MIERYLIEVWMTDAMDCGIEVTEEPNGEWVKWKDVADLNTRLEAASARIRTCHDIMAGIVAMSDPDSSYIPEMQEELTGCAEYCSGWSAEESS